jgi:hypothetical protein
LGGGLRAVGDGVRSLRRDVTRRVLVLDVDHLLARARREPPVLARLVGLPRGPVAAHVLYPHRGHSRAGEGSVVAGDILAA